MADWVAETPGPVEDWGTAPVAAVVVSEVGRNMHMKQIVINRPVRGLSVKRLLRATVVGTAVLLAEPMAAQQTYYSTPEAAANHLVLAVARADSEALEAVLGDDYRDLLPISQISEQEVGQFLDAWAAYNAVVPTGINTRMLAAGEQGWQLPIPIVREELGWRFDTLSGGRLMRIQRIGRNELAAMQAALAYRDAQLEYAMQDHDGDGVLEFAGKFISAPERQDGLYWEAGDGEVQSPLGPLFGDQTPQGAYHGYRYKILTRQGENAPGGPADYQVDGKLRGGFALIAWPDEYGSSGIMSFMVSRDGVLYESDLGPDSAETAMQIDAFDPDGRWHPVLADYTAL